jgi:acetyl-CoA carboxylase carboxyltransferase component
LQIQVASLKAKGEVITPEDEKRMLDKIIEQYSQQTTAYYAASRLWVDAIIDPIQTRSVISEGINAANHAPIEKPMNVGVFQV